jgi:ElaB/YqjD/DUF883 family membrane-anchored ribosome-binding protein
MTEHDKTRILELEAEIAILKSKLNQTVQEIPAVAKKPLIKLKEKGNKK